MINKRLINTAQTSMKYVWKNVFFQWISLIANVVIIFTIGYILEALLKTSVISTKNFILAFVIVLLAIIVRFLCSLKVSKMSFLAADEIKFTLRDKIYRKVLALGSSYHDVVATSEIIQISTEGVDQLEIYFSKYLPQFFYSLLAPLTLFVIFSFVSFKAALALLLCVPLIPLSIIVVQRIAKKLLKNYWGSYTDLGAGFLENIQGLTTLKIYSADQYKNEEMNQKAESFRQITMKVLSMQLNSITVMDLIAYGGSALGIIFAISGYRMGSIAIAGCLAIILLSSEFFIPLRLLGSFFHVAMNGMAASDKIFNLLDQPEQNMGGTFEPPSLPRNIAFEKVNFSYDGQRQVLHDICFSAQKGITAIVGESGSGKSTVASLLNGRIRPTSGVITLEGIPLSDYSQNYLLKNITYIGHNSFLFKGSVKDNLLMGKADAHDEKLWHVLAQVNLAEFLKQQNGLDFQLEEKASNLSGGQRQRLCIARALLHDSPIYVIDEATSNIDVESENDITSIIWQLAKEKTVIFISHRLANVFSADIIHVIKNGKIAESGTHQELVDKKGIYAAMFSQQQELEGIARRENVNA